MTRPDIRNKRTEQAIKDALLDTMATKTFADINVSEIARKAHISRSTFYAHFGNLGQVYYALIGDMNQQVRPLSLQLRCETCSLNNEADAPLPFCVAIRDEGRYQPLVHDPQFLETIVSFSSLLHDNDLFSQLEGAGVPSDLASAIMRFQQSGCYAVATATPQEADWDRHREALDTFIRGGIAAIRAHYTKNR